MIHKEIKYGNVENVTVIEFGGGTISVVDGMAKDHMSLLIKQIDPTPIGQITGSEKSSDDFKPEVVLLFKNQESFDVFYEFVNNIKANFNQPLTERIIHQ